MLLWLFQTFHLTEEKERQLQWYEDRVLQRTIVHEPAGVVSIQQRAPRCEGCGAPWVSCGWREAEVGDKVKKWGVRVRKRILGAGVAGSERSLHTSEKVVSEWLHFLSASCDVDALIITVVLLFINKETEIVKHLVTCPNSDSY